MHIASSSYRVSLPDSLHPPSSFTKSHDVLPTSNNKQINSRSTRLALSISYHHAPRAYHLFQIPRLSLWHWFTYPDDVDQNLNWPTTFPHTSLLGTWRVFAAISGDGKSLSGVWLGRTSVWASVDFFGGELDCWWGFWFGEFTELVPGGGFLICRVGDCRFSEKRSLDGLGWWLPERMARNGLLGFTLCGVIMRGCVSGSMGGGWFELNVETRRKEVNEVRTVNAFFSSIYRYQCGPPGASHHPLNMGEDFKNRIDRSSKVAAFSMCAPGSSNSDCNVKMESNRAQLQGSSISWSSIHFTLGHKNWTIWLR